MTEIRKLLRQKGVQAGVAVVLGAGAVAMSGVAGAAENAAQDETILAVGDWARAAAGTSRASRSRPATR